MPVTMGAARPQSQPWSPSSATEHLVSERKQQLYTGRIVQLTLDQVRLPNGSEAEFEIVHHPGGAAVVAVDDERRVCLLHQYRYAMDEWLWELPAGKRDHGEDPAHTAARELREEAGVRAGAWQGLGRMVSSPGVFTEVVHLYLATDLQPVADAVEEHEVFERHWVALDEAVRAAREGRYSDAKTVIALLRAAAALV